MLYMLPLGPGSSKANSYYGWGTKFDSFWCCYGTGIESITFYDVIIRLFLWTEHFIDLNFSALLGIESFSKLGDSIYFEEEGVVPALYIFQYISSSINWESGKFVLNQTVDPVLSSDPYLRLTITFSSTKVLHFIILFITLWKHKCE